MADRWTQVIQVKSDGQDVRVNNSDRPEATNFRIVSHFGKRDWSPHVDMFEALNRWKELPQREDGYFMLVEG